MEKKKARTLSDKAKPILLSILLLFVVATTLIWGLTSQTKGGSSDVILPGIVLLLLLAFMAPFIKRRYFDVKQGYPFEDERSKKVMKSAQAQAYLLSIWLLLILGWASEDLINFRDVSQAMGVGVAGMAILFGLSYIYFSRKGDAE